MEQAVDVKKPSAKRALWIALAAVVTVVLGVAAVLFFLTVRDAKNVLRELTVEAGEALPQAADFLAEDQGAEAVFAEALPENMMSFPGDYNITLQYRRREYPAVIHVVDTTAPAGVTRDISQYLWEELPQAEDFLVECQDVTEVAVSFGIAPVPDQAGEQTVTLLLTDISGNTTELPAVLELIPDTQAPVITGVKDIVMYVGDTVSYRSGVTVTDDKDTNPTLEVDSSQADLSAAGTYEIVYIATDAAGNTTKVTAELEVHEKEEDFVDLETIYAMADDILEEIITPEMTTREQAEAVYKWIRQNMSYNADPEERDWPQAAYWMMKRRYGDCYNYFSLCKLMMERLGIPNIDVVKVKNFPGDSMHYWSLVSVDGGETWYHYDATPRIGGGDFCLVTDAYMDAFSAGYRNCFNRDKSLYPATPEE